MNHRGELVSVELNLTVFTSPKDPHWLELADVADALGERVVAAKLIPLLAEVDAAWPAMRSELDRADSTGAGEILRLVSREPSAPGRGAIPPDQDDA